MKILHVEDDDLDAELVRKELARSKGEFHLYHVRTLGEGHKILEDEGGAFDLALIDLKLSDGNGIELLREIRQKEFPMAVVVLTGSGEEQTAVGVLKAGADDYVVKSSQYLTGLGDLLKDALHRFKSEEKKRSALINVLYAEPNIDDVDLTVRYFSRHAPHIRLEVISTTEKLIERLTLKQSDTPLPYNVLLLDYRLPKFNAIELIKYMRQEMGIKIPAVLITGHGSEDIAIQALRLGFADYIVKLPGYLHRLPGVLENSFQRSELLREQKKLKESEDRFRILYDKSPDMYASVSPADDRIVLCNETLLTHTGYSKEEVVGAPVFKLYHEDCLNEVKATLKQLVETGSIKNKVLILKKKDGGKIYVSLSVFPVKDRKENILYSVSSWRDITELRAAQTAIKESEDKFRSIFEQSPIAIDIYDSHGRLIDANPQSLKMFGLAEKRLRLGVSLWTDPKLGPEKADALKRGEAVFGETEYDFETVRTSSLYPTKRSGTVFLDLYAIPLFQNGKIIRYLVQMIEITKRKMAEKEKISLEKQLRQSQKLEAIGNLAGGIAHDFNNILSSVIGYTELALGDIEKGSNLEDNLQEVYSAGLRAKELVSQILTFARQSEEEFKPMRVDMILKEALQFIRSTIPSTITIRENITTKARILGSPTQIHQVAMNLFTNSAYAMEENGGTLYIGLSEVVIDSPVKIKRLGGKKGNYMQLTVSDTGTGIPQDIIDKIFEPYFTTKGPREGTGMGLALVHGIVRSHGGQIFVDSTPGKGTRFTIYLPMTQNRKFSHEKLPEWVLSGSERILFVDDEAALTKMGKRILQGLGYSVTTENSSRKALELFRSRPDAFDLVITDMTMPDMTGDRLAVELIRIRPGIPVILCSGYSKKLSRKTADEIGIKAMAEKPIVKEKLAGMIRSILDES